ncbi:MAG: hypothetical protein JXQ71_08700 [Verrucomicrobia bacterium]|nr:hypothetical protein [Verrucomicrobiota bacterium]
MNTRTKNRIRVVVLAALLAWPGIETCRLIVAKRQLNACEQQQHAVMLRLAQAQSAQMASQPAQP